MKLKKCVPTSNLVDANQITALNHQLHVLEVASALAVVVLMMIILWLLSVRRKLKFKSTTLNDEINQLNVSVRRLEENLEALQLKHNELMVRNLEIVTEKNSLLEYKPSDAVIKGFAFEKFIAKKFVDYKRHINDEWELLDWRSDKFIPKTEEKEMSIYAKNNQAPDLLFKNKITGKKIAVECKYRENGFDRHGKFFWSRPDQIQNYKAYSKEEEIKVFVVIGTGKNLADPLQLKTHMHELNQNKWYAADYFGGSNLRGTQAKQVYFTREELENSHSSMDDILKKIFGEINESAE